MPSLTDAPTTPTVTTADGTAKPKVMRRPAQFSATAARTEPAFTADTRIEATPTNVPSAAPQATLLRPWQEDARFAFALLAIVIIVNVALSIWLAPRTQSPTANAAPVGAPVDDGQPTTSAPESLIYHLNEAGASVSEQ